MSAPEIAVAYVSVVPSIEGFTQQLRNQIVGPAANAGDDAGEATSESFGAKLKKGLAKVGIAAGAALAKGLYDAVDQSSVTSRLQAQLGASGKDAGRYGKVAGQLYSKGITDSFQDAADAIKAVSQAGLVPPGATNKQLRSIATQAADVANVFDQDLGGVTNAVSQMLRTGLAKNATEAFNVLTVGFQSGANKADDLLDTMNEYGTQFRKLGLDGKSALGLIQQGIQGGARDADLAADVLKEFALRAVDGSATTAAGFKALGLDATDMAKKFGQGGAVASAALDLTMDKLRGIKDPVAQSAAAVNLFGTQAEDLGAALFKMDPSKATAGLGKMNGAAAKLGKAIRSGPQYEVQTFIRTLQQTLVTVLGTYVLPAVTALIQGMQNVGTWARDSFGVFLDVAEWLSPVVIAVGGLAIALNAQAIASGISTAVTWVQVTALDAAAVATGLWSTAMGILNSIMALNPFVLVAIAIVALTAAIVVAYKKSDTFRDIVQACWQGIQAAALFAWHSVLQPTFSAIVTAVTWVGNAATWLWRNAIQPAFAFINAAARILLTIWTIVVFGPIYLAVKALGAVFGWLYSAAIKPAVDAIVAAAQWLWQAVQPAINAFMNGLKTLGRWASWLYANAFLPMCSGIRTAAIRLWANGIKPPIDAVVAGFKNLGKWAHWLYDNGIRPAFTGIANLGKWLWAKALKPPFDAVRSAIGKVADSFTTAKNNIGAQWSKLADIAKKPVKFIINTVYNSGIRSVWNTVAKAFGAHQLDKISLKGWSTGGIEPGYTPGRDTHLAAVSGGEAIMRPEWTRAVGPGYVYGMNALAKRGGISAVRNALPGFADGGIFGWVGKALQGAGGKAWDIAKRGASWLRDTLADSARAGFKRIVDPLLRHIPGSSTEYGKAIRGIPNKIIDTVLGYSKTADTKLIKLGIGGKGFTSALRWARTQAGKPYQWGGNGNPSWDCSGFTSAIESVIRGEKPHRRWTTFGFNGASAPAGWVRGLRSPYMVGVTNAGVGHVAGTLNGVNVESRGGSGVLVGGSARGYRDRLFRDWYGFKYDSGGWLSPGVTYNGTNRPEPVLTAMQWADISSLAARGGSGLQPGDHLVLTVDGRTQLEAYVDRRADARIDQGLVSPARLGRRA